MRAAAAAHALLAATAVQGAYQYEGWKAAEVVPGGFIWGRQEVFRGAVGEVNACLAEAVELKARVAQFHAATGICLLFADPLPGGCSSGAPSAGAPAQCVLDEAYQLFAEPAATPSPTSLQTTESHPCGGGCVAASIALSVLWGLLLCWLAWWFRDEWSCFDRHTDIAKQVQRASASEEKRDQWHASPKAGSQRPEIASAIVAAKSADVSLPENAWMVVRRYDAADKGAVGEHRFKTWPEFLETEWVQARVVDAPAGHEDMLQELKDYFTALPDSTQQNEQEQWAVKEMVDDEKPWEEMNRLERVEHVSVLCAKFVGIWAVLYLFIVALGLMGDAFKLLGGRTSGRTFRDSEVIANPVAAVAVGILSTVLMQSSSTTTSIVISMAAADLVTVKDAAFLVMGANIGTSVTNTIVSLAHINTPDEYRRAFAGATFHDMFNWLTVLVFGSLEIANGFLLELAGMAVSSMGLDGADQQNKVDFIKKITAPSQGRIIKVDKKLIERIAAAEDSAEVSRLEKLTMIKQKSGHVFRDSPVPDSSAGGLMIFVSLAMLCVCLLMLVRLLQSVLKGRVALWCRFLLNLEFENVFCRQLGGLDNYILLLFGTGCTILVQSSSVFTATLTPLVGIGLIHIEKLTALTFGANIGTTVTGVLSALTNDNIVIAMQVALEHVFFNSLGTVLWFCIWPLRPVPLAMAKFMGGAAAQLNWFPLAYIVLCFLALPAIIFGVSVPGWQVSVGVLVPLFTILLSTCLIVYLRRNYPEVLPRCLSSDQCCGGEVPNWLRVVRDATRDEADLAEMKARQEADLVRQKRLQWPYGPFVWGAGLLATLALLLALPSSQWRRVWYDGEPTRSEWGLGLFEVCQKEFGKDVYWMADSTAACTPGAIEQWLRHGQPPPASPKHPLIHQCETNSSFAAAPLSYPAHEWTAAYYESAWGAVRALRMCSAEQWDAACIAMGAPGAACGSASSHAAFCRWPTAHWVRRSAHGANYVEDFSNHRNTTPEIAEAASNGFPTSKAASSAALYTLSWPQTPLGGGVQPASVPLNWPGASSCYGGVPSGGMPCSDAPAATGLSWDPCSGNLLFVSGAPPRASCPSGAASGDVLLAGSAAAPYQPAFRAFSMRPDTYGGSWTRLTYPGGAKVESRAHSAASGVPQFRDTACSAAAAVAADPAGVALGTVAQLPGGMRLGADLSGPKLVLIDSDGQIAASYTPLGTTVYDGVGGVKKVLPASFARALAQSGRTVGVGVVAVDATYDAEQEQVRAFVCLSRSVTDGSRLLRCAVLDVTAPSAPRLLREKLVLQSDAAVEWAADRRTTASPQGLIQTIGGSWLGGSQVAVAETTMRTGATGAGVVVSIDFSSGADILAAAGDLEALQLGKQLQPSVALAQVNATPATVRKLVDTADLPEAAAITSVSGVVVPNNYTLVLATGNRFGAAPAGSATKVITVHTDTALGVFMDPAFRCPATQYAKAWSKQAGDPANGQHCKEISAWCPGPLEGDMKSVAASAIVGTVLHGVAVGCVIYWCFFGDKTHLGLSGAKVMLAGSVNWSLGWLFQLVAWAHLLHMEESEYACPFLHDSGKGAVVHRGKLAVITDQSYAWALCIFAWSLSTMALPFIVRKAYSLNWGRKPEEEGGIPSSAAGEMKTKEGAMCTSEGGDMDQVQDQRVAPPKHEGQEPVADAAPF